MKKIALAYGVITGLVIICSIMLTIFLGAGETWLGFLIMIVAFTAIFFAIKQYRDRVLGGVIRFGTAALLGLSIVAVASVVYVAVWELYLFATHYRFIDTYTASMLEHGRAKGLSGAEWDALVQAMTQMKEQYGRPLIRLPMTFLEVFPVGVVVALISAAILRTRPAKAGMN
jgi:hypothetical protein